MLGEPVLGWMMVGWRSYRIHKDENLEVRVLVPRSERKKEFPELHSVLTCPLCGTGLPDTRLRHIDYIKKLEYWHCMECGLIIKKGVGEPI